MKYRLDFVTNSSSSSFILGRPKVSGKTVENTFNLLKKMYIEYIEKFELAKQYISHNPECGFKIKSEDKFSYEYVSTDYTLSWDQIKKNEENLEKVLGFNPSEFIMKDTTRQIPNFKTYKDYEEFWKKEVSKTTEDYIYAPFTICHLNDKDGIYNITNSGEFNFKTYEIKRGPVFEKQDLTRNSDIFMWYEDELKTDKNIDELENPCFELLGQVCIYSECGHIPEYIVEKLEKISRFHCNHMG